MVPAATTAPRAGACCYEVPGGPELWGQDVAEVGAMLVMHRRHYGGGPELKGLFSAAQELCSRDSMSLTPGCQAGKPVDVKLWPGRASKSGGCAGWTSCQRPSQHYFASPLRKGLANSKLSKLAQVGSSDHTGCPITGLAFSPLLSGFKESQEDPGLSGYGFQMFWDAG